MYCRGGWSFERKGTLVVQLTTGGTFLDYLPTSIYSVLTFVNNDKGNKLGKSDKDCETSKTLL